MKLTPITSKIKRTTRGGVVQQPLLNMGAPVKMKASSPAKQGGKNNKRNRGAAPDSKPSIKDTKAEQKGSGYKNISFKEYRESGKMDPSEAKFYKGSGQKRVRSNFEKQLPAGDGVRLTPKKQGGGSDFRETRFDTPKAKKSYDQAYKDSRKVKEYAGMSKAEYIKEAKRQTASKKAGKGWDAKRSKKEAVKPVKGAGIKEAGTKTVKTKTKATKNNPSTNSGKKITTANKLEKDVTLKKGKQKQKLNDYAKKFGIASPKRGGQSSKAIDPDSPAKKKKSAAKKKK